MKGGIFCLENKKDWIRNWNNFHFPYTFHLPFPLFYPVLIWWPSVPSYFSSTHPGLCGLCRNVGSISRNRERRGEEREWLIEEEVFWESAGDMGMYLDRQGRLSPSWGGYQSLPRRQTGGDAFWETLFLLQVGEIILNISETEFLLKQW